MGHPAFVAGQVNHSTRCHRELGLRICSPPSLPTAGCPIQAALWLEWDTTALDAFFYHSEEAERS
jgi:hypothetical protein